MTPIPAEASYGPRIAIVEERVNTVSGRIVELEHDLFGNGQPGALGKLETKIDRIEEKVGRVVVGIALLSGGSGAVAGAILKAILGG